MNKKLSISEVLFYIAYTLWLSKNMISYTYFKEFNIFRDIFKIVFIMVYILLLFKILIDDKYSIRTILWGAIFFIILLVGVKTDTRLIIEIIIFIYAARNIELKRIFKLTLLIQTIIMIITIISSYAGIIINDIWYRNDYSIRYGMGFTYCTFASNFFFHMVLTYLFIKNNKKMKIGEIIIILFINYVLYKLTDTKAVYYLISLLVLVVVLYQNNILIFKNNIFNKIIFKYSYVNLAIISIISCIIYNNSNELWALLNKAFTGRLYLAHKAYMEYGIKMFGQKITWIGGSRRAGLGADAVYNYVDSSYLNTLFNYGFIVLIVVCIAFTIICGDILKRREGVLLIVLLFLGIHSFSDPQLLQPQYHAFLFMFSIFFSEKYKYKKTKLFGI